MRTQRLVVRASVGPNGAPREAVIGGGRVDALEPDDACRTPCANRMRYVARTLAALATILTASAAGARAQSHPTPVLDLTLARHAVTGAVIDFHTGASFDVLVADDLRSTPRWSLVAAGGAGAVFGGFGDRCLRRPDGGCAPKGNFADFTLLTGVDLPLAGASARALVGPALYNGAGATSLGAQARMDLVSPTLAHVGLGFMLRATVLPSHGGEQLFAWAIGGSLALR